MVNKSYSLVAWTANGQVRMIPSLMDGMKTSYEAKIARIEAQEYDTEVGWLIARSRSWEEYARFFLTLGQVREAYRRYVQAALVCTYCSDILWRQSETCEVPTLPLLYRFLAMHHRCRRLIQEHPALRYEYEGSRLESDYLYFTRDDERARREIRDCHERQRAWRFGKATGLSPRAYRNRQK